MFKRNSIFLKVLITTVCIIVFISIFLTTLAIKISESIILKQTIDSSEKNIEYVFEDFSEYHSQVAKAVFKINKSTAFRDYLSDSTKDNKKNFNLITNLNDFFYANKDNLTPKDSYIIVSGKNNKWYSSNPIEWDVEIKSLFKEKDLFKQNLNSKINYNILNTRNEPKIRFENTVVISKALRPYEGADVYGDLFILLNEQSLNNIYSRYVEKGITYSIILQNGQVLSSSDKESINEFNITLMNTIKNASKEGESLGVLKNNNSDVTVLFKYIPFINGYLTVEINHKVSFGQIYMLKEYMLPILIFLIILSSIIIYFIYYNFTKPLFKIVNKMSGGRINKKIDEKIVDKNGDYEIKILADAYNDMIDEINLHVKNLISEQEERRKAELNALQMQINPHFLYNTLSTIKYLAKKDSYEKIDETIDALINILQNTIGTTDEKVTIREEIDNLKLYALINKLRFGEKINIDYEIEKTCTEVLIPKLLLQPFVENAFFHGFNGLDRGNISIYINKKDESVLIEIIDNGIGFDLKSLDSMEGNKNKKRKRGIGIKNVDERIKLIYGEEYGIKIESEIGFGTCISIVIPFTKSNL